MEASLMDEKAVTAEQYIEKLTAYSSPEQIGK
jgi:hypothetical protein